MKRLVSLLITAILILVPAVGFSQDDACDEARQAAQEDAKTQPWWELSCLLTTLLGPLAGLGVTAISHLSSPSVPAVYLLGKSADYVEAYTACYSDQARVSRTDQASAGCLIGLIPFAVIWAGTATILLIMSNMNT